MVDLDTFCQFLYLLTNQPNIDWKKLEIWSSEINQLMTTVFVKQPLALPGSANHNEHEQQQRSAVQCACVVRTGRQLSVLPNITVVVCLAARGRC